MKSALWAEHTRARVALAQGCFLAALGVGVIGMAVWRVLNAVPPEAEIMGGLGIAGLGVNVTAAVALMRFRQGGDANARAIWLFSRNDALAYIAVIIAAGLVFWLRSAWPDLIVAAIIALLVPALRMGDHSRRGQGAARAGGCVTFPQSHPS